VIVDDWEAGEAAAGEIPRKGTGVPIEADCQQERGILRLRGWFASRTSHSAQDDRVGLVGKGSFDCAAGSLRAPAPPLRMTEYGRAHPSG